jgi:hypothetical protein
MLAVHSDRGESRGLAGANDQHASAFEPAADVGRERNCRRRHGNGACSDPRFSARSFADVKGSFEKPIEQPARGPGPAGNLIRLFYLAEDLHVAEHQRIEAARDAKQMRGRGVIPQQIPMAAGRQQVALSRPHDHVAHRAFAGLAVGRDDVQLGTVARRQQRGFGNHAAVDEPPQHGQRLAGREGQRLAMIERRRSVINPYEQQIHTGLARRPERRAEIRFATWYAHDVAAHCKVGAYNGLTTGGRQRPPGTSTGETGRSAGRECEVEECRVRLQILERSDPPDAAGWTSRRARAQRHEYQRCADRKGGGRHWQQEQRVSRIRRQVG